MWICLQNALRDCARFFVDRRFLFLPFAAFVALSGYVGWQMGQPLSETDVLDFYAAEWVDTGPEGASASDCFGVPGDTAEVWIVVTCTRDDTIQQTEVAPNGHRITAPKEPQA